MERGEREKEIPDQLSENTGNETYIGKEVSLL